MKQHLGSATSTGIMFTMATASLAAAVVLAAAACGPRVNPAGPGVGPDGSEEPKSAKEEASAASVRAVQPPPREMLIGEMCPTGASGRPAVMPLFLRAVTWSANRAEVAIPIESRRARQFSVLAWDGHRAGIFSVAGAADVGLERKAAVGAYAGESPCKRMRKSAKSKQTDDPACVRSQSHCGLALAVLEPNSGGAPFEEDPDPASFETSGACIAEEKLLVDIDGDGVDEAYPVASFLDPVRAPAEEVLAVPRGNTACDKPKFSARRVLPPQAPKRWRGQKLYHWRGLDLLGVIDIDGDSRRELVVAYHYSDRRTWAVYSAVSTVGRLDLVGEAVPWPR